MTPRRYGRVPRLLMILAVAGLLARCDTMSAQDEFEQEALRTPSGITRTDADGRVESEDEDDWRTGPAFGGIRVARPAYPNPYSEGFVTIEVVVNFSNTVFGGLELRAYDNSTSPRLVTLDYIEGATATGAYIFHFSPARLNRKGVVRLFILDGRGAIVSYGDLLIE